MREKHTFVGTMAFSPSSKVMSISSSFNSTEQPSLHPIQFQSVSHSLEKLEEICATSWSDELVCSGSGRRCHDDRGETSSPTIRPTGWGKAVCHQHGCNIPWQKHHPPFCLLSPCIPSLRRETLTKTGRSLKDTYMHATWTNTHTIFPLHASSSCSCKVVGEIYFLVKVVSQNLTR